MQTKRTFRRVVLPTAWLLIGAVVAVSLAALAFGGADSGGDDVLVPTATGPSETVPAQVATIENTLTLDGSVTLDPAVPVTSPDAGTLVFVFAADGTRVAKGDPVYQVRVDGVADEADGSAVEEEGDDAEPPAAPAPTFVTVVAPATGRVAGLSTAVGESVDDGAAVARVARTTYTVTASIAPLERYRLLDPPREATVTIQGGPEPFRCRGLDVDDDVPAGDTPTPDDEGTGTGDESGLEDGGLDGSSSDGSASGASVTCSVPASVTVFDGLSARVEIDAGAAEDVLTVPVTAVQGLVEQGAVWVVGDDGEPQRREVRLGVSDGTDVEVLEGLEEGTEVLLYVPGSSPQDGADPDMGF